MCSSDLVLPVILRGLGRPDLYRAVAELGQFFRELCSRNIRIDALERLRDKIPTILCDLEKIYPPAFFDVMVHFWLFIYLMRHYLEVQYSMAGCTLLKGG